MRASISIGGENYAIDLDRQIDISIPLDFHGDQPNAFGLPRADARQVKGARVVCKTLTMTPHGNGTHTECIGHLPGQAGSISEIDSLTFVPSTLITVTPESPVESKIDRVVTQTSIMKSLKTSQKDFLRALIFRTLPNEPAKKTKQYTGSNPPYFTADAMRFMKESGVKHLLTDLPSVDREEDEGVLKAHRMFLVSPGDTITEMVFVDNSVKDGIYFLNLQIPNFVQDAAPSRPVLFAAIPS